MAINNPRPRTRQDIPTRTQHEVSKDALALGIAAGQFMEERGIAVAELARRIDRSRAYVSERVNGIRFIDSQVLQGIADCAGVGLHTLMVELSHRAAVIAKAHI